MSVSSKGFSSQCLYNYVDIEPVAYEDIRKRALGLYKERVKIPSSPAFKDRAKRIAFRYMVKAERVFQYIATTLGKIARLPPLNSLNPFYAELIEIATNGMYEELRKEAFLAVKIVASLWKEYREKILSGGERAKRVSTEFVGRVLSIVRRKVKSLAVTKSLSYVARHTPCIDFEKPIIIVAGMPQVGKSTFVGKVSTAKPKTSPYPFTTKNVIIGHIKFEDLAIQVIDTPGILDRAIEEMNDIERRAVAALKHLKAVTLYLIDPSRDAYYSLEHQLNVLKTVENVVGRERVIVVLNKVDKAGRDDIEKAKSILSAMGYTSCIEMSSLLGMNIWLAVTEAVKRYDELFGTRFSELLSLYSSSTTSVSSSTSS